MKRSKKLFLNTTSSLLYQVIRIAWAFILPRLILHFYGSDVNGLVSSVTSFLGFISLAECGVGAVVESSLYRPLAEKNNQEISKIIISAERFFRRIAIILLSYIAILTMFYPYAVQNTFDRLYTVSLILAVSISSFAQYYFAMAYRLLLNADQKSFVRLFTQSGILVADTLVSVALMHFGVNIQMVKLASSLLFIIQPITYSLYVKKHYQLNKRLKLDGEPIQQKWNGLAQHLASFVLSNTDVAVLTLVSTLANVSIYTVYHIVVAGVKDVVTSLTEGIRALLGNMYAKKEKQLENTFAFFEWLIHFAVTFLFTAAGLLIIPLVSVYTNGINDANYIVPAFGILITAAEASYCLRLPYNMMVLAAGHFKQTQWSAIFEAGINILISVLLVFKFGLIGVAIGTLIAMSYRTCYLAWYLSNNILFRSLRFFVKHLLVDLLICALAIVLTLWIPKEVNGYLSWLKLAVPVALITLFVLVLVNFAFYKDYLLQVCDLLRNRMKKIRL